MLSEDRLSQIVGNPEIHDPEAVAMAQEILHLRRTLGSPWAVYSRWASFTWRTEMRP